MVVGVMVLLAEQFASSEAEMMLCVAPSVGRNGPKADRG